VNVAWVKNCDDSAAPGRLWSLWDIMQRFDGGKLFISITGLSNMGHSITPGQSAYAIPRQNFEEVKRNLDFICSELANIGLPNSLVSAETLKVILESEVEKKVDIPNMPAGEIAYFSPMAFGRFRNYAADLVNRFRDELSAKIVFMIPHGKASYYQSDEPLFGNEVFNAFPSANDDIAEAGTCLALERGTACVMHLMRVSEVGLASLGSELAVSKQNDWGSYLREINKELEKRTKAAGARTPDERRLPALII
jgi:hypothetical protein